MSHVGISESIKQRKRKKVTCISSDDDVPKRTNKPKKKLNRFKNLPIKDAPHEPINEAPHEPIREAVVVLEDIKHTEQSSAIILSDSDEEIKKKNKRTVSSSSDGDFEPILTAIGKDSDSDSSFDVTRFDSTVSRTSIAPPQTHEDSTSSPILTKTEKKVSEKKKAKPTPKKTTRKKKISDSFSSEEEDDIDSNSPVVTKKTASKSKVLEKSSEDFTTDSEDQYIMARPVAKKSVEKTVVKSQTEKSEVSPQKTPEPIANELSSDDSVEEIDTQEMNIPKQKRATKVDSQIDMTVRKPVPLQVAPTIVPKKPDTRNLPKDVFGRPFKQPSFHSRQTRAEFEAQLKAEMPTRDGIFID